VDCIYNNLLCRVTDKLYSNYGLNVVIVWISCTICHKTCRWNQ